MAVLMAGIVSVFDAESGSQPFESHINNINGITIRATAAAKAGNRPGD